MIITAEERKWMLHIGAAFFAEEGERDRPESWFIEAWSKDLAALFGGLVEEGLLVKRNANDDTFWLTKAGREWIGQHRAELRLQP